MSTREMKLRKLQPQALAFAMPPMVRARRAIRVTSRVRLSRNERPEKPKTTKIRLRNETSTNADAANRPQRISISSGKMFLLYKGFHFSHWRVVIEKEDVKKKTLKRCLSCFFHGPPEKPDHRHIYLGAS